MGTTAVTLYVPPSSGNTGAAASKWGTFKNWAAEPVGKSSIYQGISKGTANGFETVSFKTGEFAAKHAEGGLFSRGLGAVARVVSNVTEPVAGFIGKMGTFAASGASALLSKGCVAFSALFEIPDIIQGFKEGRGLDQTAQSTVKVGGGVAGGAAAAIGLGLLLSNPAGWIVGGAIILGSVAGYMLGDKATGFLGHNQKGLFESDPPAETPKTSLPFASLTRPEYMPQLDV